MHRRVRIYGFAWRWEREVLHDVGHVVAVRSGLERVWIGCVGELEARC